MLFDFLKKKRQEKADDQQHWRERWQSLVPEENRSVPVTVDGQTRIAYIQINQFVVMLQDGLLMKAHFFDVCEFFQKAGYHVIWLMRCVQDVEGGYLKLVRMEDGGARCRWKWRKPTTNFGRWTSDNYNVSILIQHRQVPPEITDLKTCKTRVLQRVTWAESDDNTQMMSITLEQVKKSEEITSYIRKADESLSALGFTEHSFAHVGLVSAQASAILKTLGYDDRTCELAAIAGWLHDIGNVINRIDHAQSGAVMAFRILDKMGASPEETATIITAIGNHDEKTAFPVNPVAAALILADKMDVRANRVREKARAAFDIHDRVNYSVKKHEVTLTEKEICLTLAIDTEVCAVIEYFEIFMDRMLLCRRAAEKLGLHFALVINGQRMA